MAKKKKRKSGTSVKVKKVYPLKEFPDFSKFAILINGKVGKNFKGEKFYFNDKSDALRVAKAIKAVNKKRK